MRSVAKINANRRNGAIGGLLIRFGFLLRRIVRRVVEGSRGGLSVPFRQSFHDSRCIDATGIGLCGNSYGRNDQECRLGEPTHDD